MRITSKELKRRARSVLDGKYFLATSLSTTLMLYTFTMNILLQHTGFAASSEPSSQVLYWLLWLIMTILSSLLEVGMIKFLYSLSQGETILHPSVILYAFKNQPDTFILASGFRYLITLIWFVPAVVKCFHLSAFTTYSDLFSGLLPIAGLALIGAVPAVIAALPFCLSSYVLLDNPYCSAREALRTSVQLMKGQKKRVLWIWISFLPLLFIGIGSYGIGLLWVQPYYHTTMCQFYLELTGKAPAPEKPAAE